MQQHQCWEEPFYSQHVPPEEEGEVKPPEGDPFLPLPSPSACVLRVRLPGKRTHSTLAGGEGKGKGEGEGTHAGGAHKK